MKDLCIYVIGNSTVKVTFGNKHLFKLRFRCQTLTSRFWNIIPLLELRTIWNCSSFYYRNTRFNWLPMLLLETSLLAIDNYFCRWLMNIQHRQFHWLNYYDCWMQIYTQVLINKSTELWLSIGTFQCQTVNKTEFTSF